MAEQIAAQPHLAQTPPATALNKLPDPLEKKDVSLQALNTSVVAPSQLVNKGFWRTVLVVLVLLPLVSAVGVYAYQVYINQTLSSQSSQPKPPKIDPKLVVTPEMLPSINRTEIPVGWKKYTHLSEGYSFVYPQEWSIVDTKDNPIGLQNPDPTSSSLSFLLIPQEQSLTTSVQLQNLIKAQDQRRALRIQIATESATRTDNGLSMYQRQITKASATTLFSEAYVALDKNILQVSSDGELASASSIFNQIVRSISVVTLDSSQTTNVWQTYQNAFGYSLKYPANLTLKSNDKTLPDSTDMTKSTNILVFPTKDIQNQGGFSNLLALTLSDTEPAQTATQSATRDFGSKEFKKYEDVGQIHYVGQLSSGNWLQIALTYDSNIESRALLNQVIDTITLKEPEQLP